MISIKTNYQLTPIINSNQLSIRTNYQLKPIINCYKLSIVTMLAFDKFCCKLPAHCQLHHHIFLLLQTESDQLVLKEDLILNVTRNL